jgi:hypothetical protein
MHRTASSPPSMRTREGAIWKMSEPPHASVTPGRATKRAKAWQSSQ